MMEKAIRLGLRQENVLRSLQQHGGRWQTDRYGWVWASPSETVRILDSLVRRGLVDKQEEQEPRAVGYLFQTYKLSAAGERWLKENT